MAKFLPENLKVWKKTSQEEKQTWILLSGQSQFAKEEKTQQQQQQNFSRVARVFANQLLTKQ